MTSAPKSIAASASRRSLALVCDVLTVTPPTILVFAWAIFHGRLP
jgi:hypothetical protein